MLTTKIIIIIIILILIISIVILKKNYSYNIKPDIVITWVENNEKFQKEKNKWKDIIKTKNTKKTMDIKRFQDNKELKYCLRSIEKYFTKYNCIYLVVKDDQFPKYLKKVNTKKFKIIKHSDIIPKEYLPTYNSHVIECYLHHIPGLQEYYIYLNDDFMFYNNVDPSFFINKNGTPYSLHESNKGKYITKYYDTNINKDDYSFGEGFLFNIILLKNMGIKDIIYGVSHVPKMYKKSYDYIIENFFKNYKYGKYKFENNLFHNTSKSKFRKNDNLYLVSLLKEVLYKNWFNGEHKNADAHTIYFLDKKYKKDSLLKLNENKKFICVENIDTSLYDTYVKNMEKIFPEKSSFEI
jgi:hypothetical protein